MEKNKDLIQSKKLYSRATRSLVGGVNSPVRADPQPFPFFVDYGEGAHIIDVDENEYIDYIMGYGPLLFGHSLPEKVKKAVSEYTSNGPMYGVPTELEVELAEFIINHVKSIDKIRFVNSGTEATTSAVRLARGYTGRDKIVIMKGGYHGGHESFLVEGNPFNPKPSSDGVPQEFVNQTIPVSFNDKEEITEVFEEEGKKIAAVLTEPILGNRGIVTPVDGYHEKLRDLCDKYNSLLIFDEVITGFRIGGLKCAQGKYGIEPDLTTFAKIIGGGFPIGAIGGRAEIMQYFTPTGKVFESGTFNGHPVTMAAGLETLKYAKKENVYNYINSLGKKLREGLKNMIEEKNLSYTVAGADSMFKLFFTRGKPDKMEGHCTAGCKQRSECPRFDKCPKTGEDVKSGETDRWKRIFWPEMKENGVLLTPNQLESQFISYAHTESDIEKTLEAYKEALSSL